MFKLSQDKPEHLRAQVQAAFAASPGGGPAVAAAMNPVEPVARSGQAG